MHSKLARLGLALLAAASVVILAAQATLAQDDDPANGATIFLPQLNASGQEQGDAVVKLPPVPPDQVLSGAVPDLLPGWVVVEGDIQVPAAELERRISAWGNGTGEFETEGTYETNLWPNGVVPYQFDANVTAANRITTTTAMARWEAVSGVDFQQCAGNACTGDFVHIQSSMGNNSAVGHVGGRQVINIVSWENNFIIAHELGHTLGLWHEQSRRDRDNSVTINFNNICKATDTTCNGGFCFNGNGTRIDCDHNFDLASTSRTYGAYDFDSVMHYRRTAFSRNGNDTITVDPPNDTVWQNRIGQRDHLSTRDANVMGCMYPRANWRWARASVPGISNGSCLYPFNGIGQGVVSTPSGGTLWLEPGIYNVVSTYSKPMTWRAPNGTVTIGQ